MSELELRCTHCGAINQIEDETNDSFVCEYCGTKVLKKQSNEMIDNIKKLNLETIALQLKNYRDLLKNSLYEKNTSFKIDIAKEILKILPKDFEATLYFNLVNKIKDKRSYDFFLKSITLDYKKEEVRPFIDIMIKTADFDQLEIIERNILTNYKLIDEFKGLISIRKVEIDNEVDLYNSSIKRNVFICHSSKDKELLEEVVDELEENQGFSVWYSERNLRWDGINYWSNIKEAIANCSVFLILITDHAKHSDDVKEEIKIASEMHKKRTAYYAMDGSAVGMYISQFLGETGSQWVDKRTQRLENLSQTIYQLLNQKEEIKEEVKVINKVDNEPISNNYNNANKELDNMIERAFQFIEFGEFNKADEKLEQVLDRDNSKYKAHLGKLLIEYKLNVVDDLGNLNSPFNNSKNYARLIKYCDEQTKTLLGKYLDNINRKMKEEKRKEEERIAEEKRKEEERILERQRKTEEIQRKQREHNIEQQRKQEEEKKRLEEYRKNKERLDLVELKRYEKGLPYCENNLNYLNFGKFPQSHVNNPYLIKKLNALTLRNSNGYFEYEGNEYCKIKAHIEYDEYQVDKYLDGTKVVNDFAWFKVEPIKWRILWNNNNEYTLLSEFSLMARRFDPTSNDFQNSELQKYLNTNFYNQAFTNKEKSNIKSNSRRNSNIWLLESIDMYNTRYGFSERSNDLDKLRKSKYTDYCLASGARIYKPENAGEWWLYQDPLFKFDDYPSIVNSYGAVHDEKYRKYSDDFICVRPSIYVKI